MKRRTLLLVAGAGLAAGCSTPMGSGSATDKKREIDSGVEKALADNRPDDIPKYLTDRWLADNTLFGPAAKVREGVEAWRAAGVSTPILVPNSVGGNQITALEELFAAFG